MRSGDAFDIAGALVVRVASEQRESKNGGYVFRGLELAASECNGRVFLIIPESLARVGRKDLYDFPLLCWEGAEVAAFRVQANNRLQDGSVIYSAGPDSALVLEPRRPVSVTDAVDAVECVRAVDARYRVAHREPFYLAKGRLIHSLFDHVMSSHQEGSPDRTFDRSFAANLPALREMLLGSAMRVDEKALKQEAREHYAHLVAWARRAIDSGAVDLEVDRISTRWGLKGRADAFVHDRDPGWLVELKTGAVPVQSHHLQLFAYSLLFQKDDGRTPDGCLMYSGSGKAEQMRSIPWHTLLEGRNKVVALRRSYTQPPAPSADEDAAPELCPRSKRCLFRPQCEVMSDSSYDDGTPLLHGIAREMYDRWFRLLSLDLWETEGEFARVLNPATLAERLKEGRTVSVASEVTQTGAPLVPTRSEEVDSDLDADSAGNGYGPATIYADLFADDNDIELSSGDRVILHRGDPCGDDASWGTVSVVDKGRIRVSLHASALTAGDLLGTSGSSSPHEAGWFLDRLPFSRPREVARQALLSFFLHADPSVVQAVLALDTGDTQHDVEQHPAKSVEAHERQLADSRSPLPARDHEEASSDEELLFSEGLRCELNDEQEAAIREALAAETFHLIHGPPGTGKTRVLARLIRLCLDRGERPLVACPTNVALDRLLVALMDLGVRDFIRVGGKSAASSGFHEAVGRLGGQPRLLGDLARFSKTFMALRKKVHATPLVAATAYQCAAHPLFIRERFDRVVIDEAGQLDEPTCLGVIGLGTRFVLCGDHLQLPPVVQSRPIEGDPGLERSLFERLLGRGERSRVTRLRVQYRMNREIQDIPSRLFYEGTLTASPEAATRRLRIGPVPTDDPEIAQITDPHRPAIFVHVDGPDSGKARPEEAVVVAKVVESLLRAGVPEHEIGIITPYRVQQALIRQHLSSARAAASVDTVDRFQGGEREVIILSLARSDGVTSFLADRKRLNVSLSRARSKLILIGHGTVLETHPLFGSLLAGLKRISVTS